MKLIYFERGTTYAECMRYILLFSSLISLAFTYSKKKKKKKKIDTDYNAYISFNDLPRHSQLIVHLMKNDPC